MDYFKYLSNAIKICDMIIRRDKQKHDNYDQDKYSKSIKKNHNHGHGQCV